MGGIISAIQRGFIRKKPLTKNELSKILNQSFERIKKEEQEKPKTLTFYSSREDIINRLIQLYNEEIKNRGRME